MEGFCDIHMHLIPGVDDGAMSLEMAQDMVIQSMLQGCKAIFATPHSSAFLSWPQEVHSNLAALRETLARLGLQLPIYLGCEVLCSALDMSFLEDLKSGRLPSINHSPYVLAEFASNIPREELFRCVRALRAEAYRPIIAHAERYKAMTCSFARDLRLEGCGIQINTDSLAGEPDDKIRQLARELIRERIVDYLGTDAHNSLDRPPLIRDGLDWLTAELSDDRAYLEAITRGNAERDLL